MTDRYDEMRVSPDTLRAEELRQRLHARMAGASSDDHERRSIHRARRDADARSVEAKEMYMSIESPTSEQRNRWRVPAAAAAVVAVIGVAGIALALNNRDSDADQTPAATTTAAPTTVAPTTTLGPRIVTGGFAGGGDDIPATFLWPSGWTRYQGWLVSINDESAGAGVAFWDVGNIYADGCQWVLVDPPIGPTVDDLVAAYANLPELAATPPVDITVDGYDGKQIEFTVPVYDEDDCKVKVGFGGEGNFGLWQQTGSQDISAGPDFWAQGPGSNMHNQLWILDVDGRRLVIDAYSFPDTSPEERTALDEVLASIQIG